MRTCIVNFSDNAGNFKIGQTRLVNSLTYAGYKGDIQLYNSHEELGCKTHFEVPYQFKVYAIYKAYKQGYDTVLYCDSSIYAVKDISPCLEHVRENGYLLEQCGFQLGQWCSDRALEIFGINRDEAFNMPMHSAGFTGLNFNTQIAKDFIEQWYDYAKNEETFKGAWTNANNEVSEDKRCSGHRHDQSVATYLANKLGMKAIPPNFMQYYHGEGTPINKSTIFYCQGI